MILAFDSLGSLAARRAGDVGPADTLAHSEELKLESGVDKPNLESFVLRSILPHVLMRKVQNQVLKHSRWR